jgi:hypothetical protein
MRDGAETEDTFEFGGGVGTRKSLDHRAARGLGEIGQQRGSVEALWDAVEELGSEQSAEHRQDSVAGGELA